MEEIHSKDGRPERCGPGRRMKEERMGGLQTLMRRSGSEEEAMEGSREG